MSATAEYFNIANPLQAVIRRVKCNEENLEKDPNKIDLRFFSHIHLTDTYNGKAAPMDGMRYEAILYGNQIVWEFHKFYHNGAGFGSDSKGSAVHKKMFEVAQLYLKILSVARAKFFREEGTAQPGTTAEEAWYIDKVLLHEPETNDLLFNHPQYRELVRNMGLDLKPTERSGWYEVIVTKSHDTANEAPVL